MTPVEILSEVTRFFPKDWARLEPELFREKFGKDWTMFMAIKTVKSQTDLVLSDLGIFENVVIALSGIEPIIGQTQICQPGEILWATSLIELITKKTPKDYGHEVRTYIQACFSEHGVYAYPEELKNFEPEDDKATKDRIRSQLQFGTKDIDSDDLIKVQTAKLGNVYAQAESIASRLKML